LPYINFLGSTENENCAPTPQFNAAVSDEEVDVDDLDSQIEILNVCGTKEKKERKTKSS
jgi:hypothetical protein